MESKWKLLSQSQVVSVFPLKTSSRSTSPKVLILVLKQHFQEEIYSVKIKNKFKNPNKPNQTKPSKHETWLPGSLHLSKNNWAKSNPPTFPLHHKDSLSQFDYKPRGTLWFRFQPSVPESGWLQEHPMTSYTRWDFLRKNWPGLQRQ